MDKGFDGAVEKIAKTMDDVRRTYKDPEYLRDPLKPEASAARRADDRARANYEATKQALDLQRTKYIIRQSDQVAKDAENFSHSPAI